MSDRVTIDPVFFRSLAAEVRDLARHNLEPVFEPGNRGQELTNQLADFGADVRDFMSQEHQTLEALASSCEMAVEYAQAADQKAADGVGGLAHKALDQMMLNARAVGLDVGAGSIAGGPSEGAPVTEVGLEQPMADRPVAADPNVADKDRFGADTHVIGGEVHKDHPAADPAWPAQPVHSGDESQPVGHTRPIMEQPWTEPTTDQPVAADPNVADKDRFGADTHVIGGEVHEDHPAADPAWPAQPVLSGDESQPVGHTRPIMEQPWTEPTTDRPVAADPNVADKDRFGADTHVIGGEVHDDHPAADPIRTTQPVTETQPSPDTRPVKERPWAEPITDQPVVADPNSPDKDRFGADTHVIGGEVHEDHPVKQGGQVGKDLPEELHLPKQPSVMASPAGGQE